MTVLVTTGYGRLTSHFIYNNVKELFKFAYIRVAVTLLLHNNAAGTL